MTIAVSGSPVPTLQWQVSGDAGASWTSLTNGGPYSGVSSNTLTITGAPLSLSGSLYRCAATNRVSTAVGNPAFLMLTRASVATLAGSATAGSVDGSGSAASFFHPGGVAVDAAGNVYVADTFNHRIRVVNPAGLVTTLAGAGVQGSADDTGTAAGFSYPRSVAVDASGNVYVADAGNHAIRRVSPAGVVTTFAGSGSSGSADGAGTAASFNCPSGVAADAAGNLYVADSCNQRIRHISPAGVVTTLAGSGSIGAADGTGTVASLAFPRGVAVDSAGIVYVADTSNFKIRRVSPDGVVTTLAGSGSYGPGDGSGSAAGFHLPETVATDPSGNVYVADSSDCMIRAITPAGAVLTSAGHLAPGATDGTGAAAVRTRDHLGGAIRDRLRNGCVGGAAQRHRRRAGDLRLRAGGRHRARRRHPDPERDLHAGRHRQFRAGDDDPIPDGEPAREPGLFAAALPVGPGPAGRHRRARRLPRGHGGGTHAGAGARGFVFIG
jgi:sugar lactone lactonase YvrE